MHQKQQIHLVSHAERRGSNMFQVSTEKISSQLEEQFKALHKEFHDITRVSRTRVRDLIMMMLNLDGIVKTEDGEQAVVVWTAHGSKEKVQQATQQVMLEWAAKWCMGTATDVGIDAREAAIPEIYCDNPEDADDSDSSDPDELDDDGYKAFLAREAEDEFP